MQQRTPPLIFIALFFCIFHLSAEKTNNSIHSRLSWHKLRQIQIEHNPEFVSTLNWSQTDFDDGLRQSIGFRIPTQEAVSFILHGYSDLFNSKNSIYKDQNLLSARLGLQYQRKNESFLLRLETGHKGHLGTSLFWDKYINPKFSFGLSTEAYSQKTSLISLQFNEKIEKLNGYFSYQLPSNLFYTSNHSIYYSKVYNGHHEKAWSHQHILTAGMRLISNSDWRIRGFYNHSLRYQQEFYQYFYIGITENYQIFHANQAYRSLINPADKINEQAIKCELSLPLSSHFGFIFNGEIGQDYSRDIQFGKKVILHSTFKWFPTYRTRFTLENRYSTENTGRIRGDNLEFIISFHVNT